MSRSLLVLGAIAVVSVCGFWVHATRAPVSRPVPAARSAERVSAATTVAATKATPPTVVAAPGGRPGSQATVAASQGEETGSDVATTAASTVPFAADMRIAEDPAAPESGPALSIQEMQDLARREGEGLVTIRNADGSETLDHQGRFEEYFVLRVGKDGKPEMVCVTGETAAKHALQRTSPTTPKKGR